MDLNGVNAEIIMIRVRVSVATTVTALTMIKEIKDRLGTLATWRENYGEPLQQRAFDVPVVEHI